MANVEKEIKKEIKNEEKAIKRFFSKKENVWMSISIILVIIVIVLGIFFIAGNGLSKNAAGKKLVDFLNTEVVQSGEVTLKSVSSDGSLYTVLVTYQNKDIPVLMTKDGKYFIQGATEITSSAKNSDTGANTPQDVPKSDKPKVQLFVWAYCPYGVQAQGPMAEVANLLKGKADFEIVPYYDGHGAYETQQNKIQLCIQKLYADKYWSYAKGFVDSIYSKCGATRTEECDKTESIALMKKLGIDSTKVINCVDTQGTSLFGEASSKAQSLGVSGSPTIMINGVPASVARNAESIKTTVCSAFKDTPSECSQAMSSTASASSGSCG